MGFVFRMTARELRASWRRLVFFFVCVAIGVAAIVTLRSIIQSLRTGLMREARATIAADVIVQTNRPWEPAVKAELEARLARAPVLARSESIETATMVRAEQGAPVARMVELRGVAPGFPFYGTLLLQNGLTYSHDLLSGGGALVRPELLSQLGVSPGRRIVIGGRPFTIRGVIDQEPGRRVGGFSLGSRVIVDLADLRQTGLLSFGSRANYQILLKLRDDGVDPLTRDVRTMFRDRFVTARSYKSTEDQIGESLLRAENFLSLVGFVIVVLGGIGVWSVTRVFVRQKIRSVAILKCIGASTAQVLATYVLQVALLAMAGSLIGVGLSALAILAIPERLTASFGGLPYGLTWSAIAQGLTVGLLVSVLFALVPLLDVRRIKPLLLIRGGEMTAAGATVVTGPFSARFLERFRRVDWLQLTTAATVGGALVLVAAWQAGSWRAGTAVSLGFAGVAAVLYGAGWVLIRIVSPLSDAPWFPLRHAVISLRRPGNQTRVILLAVGLGSFFVLGVKALQDNLIAEFAVGMDRGGADMFLIDIQKDQTDGVRALIQERQDPGAPGPRLLPVLRARVTFVRGREVNLENVGDVRGRGSLAREYTITYRDALAPNEAVVQGKFWQPPSGAAGGSSGSTGAGRSAVGGGEADGRSTPEEEVSIEESIHERFKVNVGDEMRFDVAGRTIGARVTSVRHVEWGDSRSGGFMFVFRPGALEQAPHTFVAFIKGPDSAEARGRLQYDLASRYPNVTAIDGREILARIRVVVDNAVLGISIVGGIALLSGVLILVGAVAMTKFQRVYEAAILRTLGASTRLLTATIAVEYGALGLLAGLIGAAGAFVLSWGVARYVLDIPWRPVPGLLAAGALLTMLLVGLIGVLASGDVLRKKPLATLRAE
jgi:putative ABC transport system permease protein